MKARRKAYALFRLLLVLSAMAAILGCAKEREAREPVRPDVTGVTVKEVALSDVEDFFEAAGTVRARTESVVSSRVMGTVTAVKVREGERVRKGQLMLTIDERDSRARLQAAEEGLNEALRALDSATRQKELADKTYARYRNLHEQDALSTQELDAAETAKDVAASELERSKAMAGRMGASVKEAKVNLEFTRVVAPIDGVVTRKLIDEGSMAAPGVPLFIVEQRDAFRMEANVEERHLGVVKKGMSVGVFIDALDRQVQGSVSEVVPSVDPSTRTFLVKVDVPDGALRSGMYGKARFATGTRQALLVPEGSIVRKGQLTGVYAVDGNGLVAYRLIRAGRSYPEGVEVLSGLATGESIITEGIEKAVDGGIVK